MLYTLQHIGYTIPPQADAGWIGEAGPGPSYLDPGSGGPENDFTNRNTTFMTWNLMHLARLLKDAGGVPAYGNQRSEWDAGLPLRLREPRVPLTAPPRRRSRHLTGTLLYPKQGRSRLSALEVGAMTRADGPCGHPDDGHRPPRAAARPDESS